MSDRPNRNEQRRARELAAREGIGYQQALLRLRDAGQSPAPGTGPMQPGETRTVIVAWRVDDAALGEDGRFWMRVREETAGALGKPVGTIVPKGFTLGWWRARATGDEVETPNPVTGGHERFSLERWSAADAQRTHVLVSFSSGPPPRGRSGDGEPAGFPHHPGGGVRTPISLEPSEEAKRLRAEQAELQDAYRAASDRGDDRRMRELAPALTAKADGLARAAFPDITRGWNLSRAVREGADRYVLDWTTGY